MGMDHSRGGRTTSKRRRPHSSAGATLWFFRNSVRLGLFISYLLLQVCPYKIQPEKQGKLIWITGPPGLGMKLFFFHLDFHFLNILQSNFSQLPFTHLPMAFLGTKLLQYGFSFKLTGFPCYHLSISPKGKSTSAQLLARKHGYVFYEGDCFFTLRFYYSFRLFWSITFPQESFHPCRL